MNFEIVSRIVSERLSEKAVSAERFPVGLQHYVFDVQTESGKKIVVRVSKPEHRHLAKSAVYWNEFLRPKGIPLPEIIAADLNAEFPFVILERLPGNDLGQVYETLSASEKKALAKELTRLQIIAAGLPKAKSFGYLESFASNTGNLNWVDVLLKYLERSRSRISKNGYFDAKVVDRVEVETRRFADYFSGIEPIAFFDDVTTKNVIVCDGRLSGIVDVDRMCFGDPIQTIALTNTALLADNRAADYIEFWCEAMRLNDLQKRVLNLYTAIYCVDFISEIGQTFNKAAPLAFDQKRADRLFEMLDDLLAKV